MRKWKKNVHNKFCVIYFRNFLLFYFSSLKERFEYGCTFYLKKQRLLGSTFFFIFYYIVHFISKQKSMIDIECENCDR